MIQFLDATDTVIASNGFDLVAAGLPNTGPSAMSGFLYTTPEVTAPANTAKVRAGVFMMNAYNANANPQSFFVDGLDLQSVAPPGAPVITNQPAGATAFAGGNASFGVGVSNPAGTTYKWQFNNVDLPNNPPHNTGATSTTLSITGVTDADKGRYRVKVSNASGYVYSTAAPLALTGINFFPVISINGKIGDTYRIDYSTVIDPATWIPLSTNKLTSSPQMFIDSTSPNSNQRFYREVFLY